MGESLNFLANSVISLHLTDIQSSGLIRVVDFFLFHRLIYLN